MLPGDGGCAGGRCGCECHTGPSRCDPPCCEYAYRPVRQPGQRRTYIEQVLAQRESEQDLKEIDSEKSA